MAAIMMTVNNAKETVNPSNGVSKSHVITNITTLHMNAFNKPNSASFLTRARILLN